MLTNNQYQHTGAFRLVMWVRIGYGALRVLLGLTLLRYIGQPFSAGIFWLMSHEFAGKHDLLIQILKPLALHVHYHITFFVALYLLFWGVLDIFLSLQLLWNRMWAYPVSLVLISCFMTYEFFRLLHTHSLALAFLIIYDLLALWLIWREYKKLAKREQEK